MKYKKKINYLDILSYQVGKFNEEFEDMKLEFRPIADFKFELKVFPDSHTVSLGLFFQQRKNSLFYWTVTKIGDINNSAYQILEYLNQFVVDHMYQSIHKMHKILCEPIKM